MYLYIHPSYNIMEYRHTDTQSHRHTDIGTDTHKHTHKHTCSPRVRHTDTHRHTQKHRHRKKTPTYTRTQTKIFATSAYMCPHILWQKKFLYSIKEPCCLPKKKNWTTVTTCQMGTSSGWSCFTIFISCRIVKCLSRTRKSVLIRASVM